jgi:hypothetical protein
MLPIADVPLTDHEYGTYMMMHGGVRHILALFCEMFAVALIMTAEYIEEGILHGLHARQN